MYYSGMRKQASQQPRLLKHSLEAGDEASSKAAAGDSCNAASKAVIRTSHVACRRHAGRMRLPIGAAHSPPSSFPAAESRRKAGTARPVGPPSPVALRQLPPAWGNDLHKGPGSFESLFGGREKLVEMLILTETSSMLLEMKKGLRYLYLSRTSGQAVYGKSTEARTGPACSVLGVPSNLTESRDCRSTPANSTGGKDLLWGKTARVRVSGVLGGIDLRAGSQTGAGAKSRAYHVPASGHAGGPSWIAVAGLLTQEDACSSRHFVEGGVTI